MKNEFHVTNVHEMGLHLRLQIHILHCKEQQINAANRHNDIYCELCKGQLHVSLDADVSEC
jgi:hypothetical protein